MSQHPTTGPGRAMRAAGPALAAPVHDDPDAAAAEGLTPAHGRHTLWCASGLPDGATVAEHGPLCESHGLVVDAWGNRHEPRNVWAAVVQPYTSGAYRPEDLRGPSSRPYVQLVWEEDDPAAARLWGANLTPGDARSLAAGLVRLADLAEGHDLQTRRQGGEAR